MPSSPARPGFTLVELLVVILIIALLVSLIGAAVFKALAKGKEVRNHDEISQLANAIENFKAKYGFYPPSRVKLCDWYDWYFVNSQEAQLDEDSIQALTKMFGRATTYWRQYGIDWGNDGIPNPNQARSWTILEGHQCLVFFLGGIPAGPRSAIASAPNMLGFSTNPQNPADKTPDRIGPFYEFQNGRLCYYLPGPFQPFFSYADTYSSVDPASGALKGQVYAYFGSGKSPNNYNRYVPNQMGNLGPDCNSVPAVGINVAGAPGPLALVPYADVISNSSSPTHYLSPTSFQIISAGADGTFGTSLGLTPNGPVLRPWTPAAASSFWPDGHPGKDDQTNFYGALMGTTN